MRKSGGRRGTNSPASQPECPALQVSSRNPGSSATAAPCRRRMLPFNSNIRSDGAVQSDRYLIGHTGPVPPAKRAADGRVLGARDDPGYLPGQAASPTFQSGFANYRTNRQLTSGLTTALAP